MRTLAYQEKLLIVALYTAIGTLYTGMDAIT